VTDLELAERVYRIAVGVSNRSLGQNSRREILDLVEVRDKAYAYINLLEIELAKRKSSGRQA